VQEKQIISIDDINIEKEEHLHVFQTHKFNEMRKIIIVINCKDINKKDFHDFQDHLFNNNHQWHSSKFKGERKYKDQSNLLIIEDGEIFNGDENILIDIEKESIIKRFNSPVEYTRYFKIKKLKTKFK